MNTTHYKQRLLDLEETLSARIDRALAKGGGPETSVGDTGDASMADATADEEFTGAERDSAVRTQVREALVRIGDGTFGKCIVDGGPIDEKRLEAMPWTPYCVVHERQVEGASPPKLPTL